MIVKKKLAKKTAKNNTSTKGKSNRGRPRKEFKPKHKRIQEQAQTNAATTIVEHRLPTRERILRMPSKDKSIFYLFIFSILLFLFSLVISFIKKDDIQELQDEAAITATTWTETEVMAPISSAAQTIENMYWTINTCIDCVSYWDASLKNSNTVRTYFSNKRLSRFISGIKDGTITISDIKEEQLKDYSRKVEYKLSYTLLDGQPFEEQWNATVLKKDGIFTIAAIKCETIGCSRMPFFNPGKYGIK